MTVRRLRREQYTVSRWSGGVTAQIAISPPGADYGERKFLWRVSSAAVELEESVFTSLPCYSRWIATLEGSIVLTHDGGAPVQLAPYEVHAFDGGSSTRCQGRCTDFNLMLRKGACGGSLRTVRFAQAGELPALAAGGRERTLLVYCCAGGGALTGPDGAAAVSAGESLLAEGVPGGTLGLEGSAGAVFLIVEIYPV